MKPTPGWVIVESRGDSKTDSGIYMSPQVNSPTPKGKVLAVGPTLRTKGSIIEPPVSVGEEVMYFKEGSLDMGGNKTLVRFVNILTRNV